MRDKEATDLLEFFQLNDKVEEAFKRISAVIPHYLNSVDLYQEYLNTIRKAFNELQKENNDLNNRLNKIKEIVETWKLGERGCSVFDDTKVITDIIKLLKEENK